MLIQGEFLQLIICALLFLYHLRTRNAVIKQKMSSKKIKLSFADYENVSTVLLNYVDCKNGNLKEQCYTSDCIVQRCSSNQSVSSFFYVVRPGKEHETVVVNGPDSWVGDM
jgi:hypothetical protein